MTTKSYTPIGHSLSVPFNPPIQSIQIIPEIVVHSKKSLLDFHDHKIKLLSRVTGRTINDRLEIVVVQADSLMTSQGLRELISHPINYLVESALSISSLCVNPKFIYSVHLEENS